MRSSAIIFVFLTVCGCVSGGPPPEARERLAECFAEAAYRCVLAERSAGTDEQDDSTKPCCGQCGGTGKVLSGDGLALVDCECDPSCECKQNPKSCNLEGGCGK